MTLIARLLIREWWNQPTSLMGILVNLSFASIGFLSLAHFQDAFFAKLNVESRELAGGDIIISGRRMLKPQEMANLTPLLPPNTITTQVMSIYTMLALPTGQSRLVLVQGIDPKLYPLYGQLQLEPNGRPDDANAWGSPEVFTLLDLKQDSPIQIGVKLLKLAGRIQQESSSSAAVFGNLAPKVLMSLDALRSSGLITDLSTVNYSFLYRLPVNFNPGQLNELVKRINQALPDPALRIDSHTSAAESSSRVFIYFESFLGLISLIALLLGGIATAYLGSVYLNEHAKYYANLRCLGLSRWQLTSLWLAQWLSITVIVTGLSTLAVELLILSLHSLAPVDLPIDLSYLKINWGLVALIALINLSVLALVLRPKLVAMLNMNLNEVLLGEPQLIATGKGVIPPFEILVSYALAPLLLFTLAWWWSFSWTISGIFVLSLTVLWILFYAMGWGLCSLLKSRAHKSRHFVSRWVQLSMGRRHHQTALTIGAYATTFALITLTLRVTQILTNELKTDTDQPQLFMFDIQDDQITELMELIQTKQLRHLDQAALVRGRITAVNGKVFTKDDSDERPLSREAENERRFRNRGLNLSYRSQLYASEDILEGQWIDAIFNGDGAVAASVEERFAQRLGLKLNDELQLDVQGVEFTARISSLRRVEWTRFEPNFFVILQPGAIDDAPKTHIVSLNLENPTEKSDLQKAIVQKFPNVSIVDVVEVTQKLIALIQTAALAILLTSLLVAINSGLVAWAIFKAQSPQRQRDHSLLRLLGVELNTIRHTVRTEWVITLLISAALGVPAGLMVAASIWTF